MIKFAHLKQRFDVKLMQQEVERLESGLWQAHYNTYHYEGGWTTLPLRSINGSVENSISIQASSLQKNMAYKNTSLLDVCPYLHSVISFFECEKMSVRLMNLNAGAIIKEHSDYDMNFEKGEARFHIPIQTNADVHFFIEDREIPMGEGECWYLNLSLKHRVKNCSNTNRIHLVIDCKVNEWLENLLAKEAELREETAGEKEARCSDEDKIKIIRQLRKMGTSKSNELADKLESGND
ncbi:MAG: aspartyl/asparaginyl beta-hydroxylase domain-containing protein [Ginsengibacter sp.]